MQKFANIPGVIYPAASPSPRPAKPTATIPRGLTPQPILLATPGDQPHRHLLITLADLEKLRTA